MSGKTPRKFKNKNPAILIAGKKIQKYQNTFVIAEVASSHEGKKELAINLLKAAAETGADAVKFQVFSVNELLTPYHPKYASFCQIELKPSEWIEIYNVSKHIGISFIAEVFDEKSFSLMEELGVNVYKIHSTDLTNTLLLEKVAITKKPVFLSCGGSTFEEIKYAIKIIESKSNHNIILLHGFQGFPTKLEDTFLLDMPKLEQGFVYPVGFADHSDAETEYAIVIPLVAIGMGACVIEKHITLNRSLRGRDYYSALNPDEFKHMVSLIRKVELAFGSHRNVLSAAEMKYRKLMKKSIVTSMPIAMGEEVDLSNLAFKRTTEPGAQPMEYLKFVGRKAKRDFDANMLIKEDDLI